jgi:pSer/pThr/pTyr-binding forkhead associated (FHA) protein
VFDHAFLDAFRGSVVIALPALMVAAIVALMMRGGAALARKGAPRPVPQPAGASSAPPPALAVAAVVEASAPVAVPAPLGPVVTASPPPVIRAGVKALGLPALHAIGGGGEYPITRSISIGRDPRLDVVLDDPTVSRHHAQITVREGTVAIRDLNSTSGTFVNGEPVSRERPLHDGDVVAVGGTAFMFRNPVERARPRLQMLTEGRKEYDLQLGQELTFGRTPGNDVILEDSRVSRHHALVSIQDGQVVVRDLESLNGTWVNGAPVTGSYPLQDGDIVVMGQTPCIFHADAV